MSRFLNALLTGAAGENWMVTGEPDEPITTPWSDIQARARIAADRLRRTHALAPNRAVAILAGQPSDVAPLAQAVWWAGGSITMLHQPTARTDLAGFADETLAVLRMIDAAVVVLGAPFDGLRDLFAERDIPCAVASELLAPRAADEPEPAALDPDLLDDTATALLQLTSGSTATPRAVRITHGNLVSNMDDMIAAANIDGRTDVMVSWLPLFHDMGMVGFLTLPMAIGMRLVSVTPPDFLARPVLWMELISRYRGTITAAPNFAYAIVARVLPRADGLDLSSLRFALNGAEPIDAEAVRRFTAAGAPFGMDERCVVCAYGMAEATLGISFAPMNTGIEIDEVDADALEHGRVARAPAPGTPDSDVRRFPRLGPPLAGIEARVVDDSGQVRGDREVGVLQLRGAAISPGYLTVEGPVPTVDADGWLDTGDEGYLVDGQVVVCGRRKDVIIMGGRNIYPTDIERAAMRADGVRAGNAVAVRFELPGGRESFVVAVESRQVGEPAAEETIRKGVMGHVVGAVGVRPAAVVVLGPTTLPKTPSGKLRREESRRLVADLLANAELDADSADDVEDAADGSA